MKRILCLTALVLLASAAAFADIARPEPAKTPKPSKGVTTTMSIRLDRNATDVKLIIPKSQIKQLKAELDKLDDGSDDTAATTTTSPSSISRTQTIVSGAFLSLALVFGGMWFVRSGKSATKTGKTLVILAIIAGAGSAATLVSANAGPPPITTISSSLFDKDQFRYRRVSGKVKIETSDETTVQFIVPDPQPGATPGSEE